LGPGLAAVGAGEGAELAADPDLVGVVGVDGDDSEAEREVDLVLGDRLFERVDGVGDVFEAGAAPGPRLAGVVGDADAGRGCEDDPATRPGDSAEAEELGQLAVELRFIAANSGSSPLKS
jgi:hypothetical protein